MPARKVDKVRKTPLKKKPGAPVPITTQEVEWCHIYIRPGQTAQSAAVAVGLPPERGKILLNQARIREYIAEYRKVFMVEMARQEVTEIAQDYEITRTKIVARAWSLANLTPERTRGSIDGQVKALERIATLLGLDWTPRDIDKALDGMTDEELRYVAEGGALAPLTHKKDEPSCPSSSPHS